MKRFLVAVMTFLLLGSPVWADSVLTLSGQTLDWDTTSQPSPTFTVGIANNGVTDTLQGWSLGLEIVAGSGASGTLSFATATLPSTNYLLNGNSQVQEGLGFIPGNPTLPATSILPIADFIFTGTTGVTVPSSGDNLLSLTFAASSMQGTFQIVEIPDPNTGSYWFSGSNTIVSFGNSPFGGTSNNPTTGTPVSIGSLTLSAQQTVPEPHSVWLLLSGLATLVTYHRVRQIRLR